MACYKIDKIDKIFLCLILIIMSFISVFNLKCYCYDTETITPSVVTQLRITPQRNFFLGTSDSSSVGYFEIEKGYKYTVTYTGNSTLQLASSSNVPKADETYQYLGAVVSGETFSYISDGNTYFYFGFSNYSSDVSVTREKISGFSSAVTDLVNMVGPSSLWQTFENTVPYIAIVVFFGFGIYYVFHMIREISQGKEKM